MSHVFHALRRSASEARLILPKKIERHHLNDSEPCHDDRSPRRLNISKTIEARHLSGLVSEPLAGPSEAGNTDTKHRQHRQHRQPSASPASWPITGSTTEVLAGANMAEDPGHSDPPRSDNIRRALEAPSSTIRRRRPSSTTSIKTNMTRATRTMGTGTGSTEDTTRAATADSTTTEATEEEDRRIETINRSTMTLGRTVLLGEEDAQCLAEEGAR